MLKTISYRITFLCIAAFLVWGCVEQYDVTFDRSVNILSVEGNLTDTDSSIIKLSFSGNSPLDFQFKFIENATVSVLENGREIPYEHRKRGIYMPVLKSFRGKQGRVYQLKIKLMNGSVYESTPDTMLKTIEINKIYDEYDSEKANKGSIDDPYSNKEKIRVYVDLPKTNNRKSYYFYKWTHFVSAYSCGDCERGRYIRAIPSDCSSFGVDCAVYDPIFHPYFFRYYPCSGNCWLYLSSRSFRSYTDFYVTTPEARRVLAAEIPFNNTSKYFIVLDQFSVSREAYLYYQLLEQTSKNSGSLFDPLPVALVGNVYNPRDATEKVIGFFTVAGVLKKGHPIFKSKFPSIPNSRELEIDNPFPTPNGPPPKKDMFGCFPPYFECKNTDIRTNIKPVDWDE
jgi:hypothetical protein